MKPTVEQIQAWRDWFAKGYAIDFNKPDTGFLELCDLALSAKKEGERAALRAAPSLTKEEWGMLFKALDFCLMDDLFDVEDNDPAYVALLAKVKELASKEQPVEPSSHD